MGGGHVRVEEYNYGIEQGTSNAPQHDIGPQTLSLKLNPNRNRAEKTELMPR